MLNVRLTEKKAMAKEVAKRECIKPASDGPKA